MYGNKCLFHNLPLNREHLAKEHGNTIDPAAALRCYQDSMDRRIIKLRLWRAFVDIKEMIPAARRAVVDQAHSPTNRP